MRLAQSVSSELAKVGYQPSPLRLNLVSCRIADRGQQEYESLRRYNPWLGPFETLCSHSMGLGASLTEFLIGGLPIDEKLKSEIATIGSIVNTVIAVFDALLDHARSAPTLFADTPNFSADTEICARQKLVVDLVGLYFGKLKLLPGDCTSIRATVDKAVRRLYIAEMSTASPCKLTWTTWWRKNALHTVVLGLPAWLNLQAVEQAEYARHLRWMGRVGEFFGWLDDAADYELDRVSGDANWLLFQHPYLTRKIIDNRAKRIAAAGQRILEFWDSRNPDSPARDTFIVLAWMWVTERSCER